MQNQYLRLAEVHFSPIPPPKGLSQPNLREEAWNLFLKTSPK